MMTTGRGCSIVTDQRFMWAPDLSARMAAIATIDADKSDLFRTCSCLSVAIPRATSWSSSLRPARRRVGGARPAKWAVPADIGRCRFPPARPRPAVTAPQPCCAAAEADHTRGDRRVDHAGVQAGKQHRVEPVPRRILIAGVWPAAGHQGAEPDRQPHQHERDPGDGHRQARCTV